MPYKPKKPCGYPGCPKLIPAGTSYCTKHKRVEQKRYNANRPIEDKYYGTNAWRRLRTWYIRDHPMCEQCKKEGRDTIAVTVDHIIPRKCGGRDIEENLQSLCPECTGKKNLQDRKKPQTGIKQPVYKGNPYFS